MPAAPPDLSHPKVDLSKFENAWYRPGNILKRGLWYVCNRLFLNTSIPYPYFFKRFLLVLFGAGIGDNLAVKPNVNIKFPWFLEVGHNVWIGEGVWIDNLAQVTLGNNVCLSQGSFVLTGNHNYKTPTFDLMVSPVLIEDGVWVGAKAIVCPGVVLATHSVITVGSVIQKDTESYVIYGGNPAVPLRKREITETTLESVRD